MCRTRVDECLTVLGGLFVAFGLTAEERTGRVKLGTGLEGQGNESAEATGLGRCHGKFTQIGVVYGQRVYHFIAGSHDGVENIEGRCARQFVFLIG